MLISYEPNSDVLTITIGAGAVAQQQVQGTTTVNYDATGAPLSVAIPEASSLLWEHGGQVNVVLPQARVVAQVVETLPPAI
jgi:uncharacterized protein YuzE